MLDDEYFMRQALQEAHVAFDMGEVPVGAVIVSNQRIIARAHNLTETLTDVTAHAEMQAITSAANVMGGKYLTDCTYCLRSSGRKKRIFTCLRPPVASQNDSHHGDHG